MNLPIPGKLYVLVDKPKYVWHINTRKTLGCHLNGCGVETNCKNLMYIGIDIRESEFIFLHKFNQIRMDSASPFQNIKLFLNDWEMI